MQLYSNTISACSGQICEWLVLRAIRIVPWGCILHKSVLFSLCYTMFDRLLPDMFSLNDACTILIVILYDMKLDSEAVYIEIQILSHLLTLCYLSRRLTFISSFDNCKQPQKFIMYIVTTKWGSPCKDFCIVLTYIVTFSKSLFIIILLFCNYFSCSSVLLFQTKLSEV